MQPHIYSYVGWPMTDVRQPRCVAAALLVIAGVLSGCTSNAACGASTMDANACSKPAATAAGGLPTFTDGVGMSEWLTYRSTDIRALSYSPRAVPRTASKARIDALLVEECAPLEHSVTVSHELWRVAGTGGGQSGRVAGELVSGAVRPDRPLSLSAGKCAQTTLAVAVPAAAKPATVHYGPVATWVIPSD